MMTSSEPLKATPKPLTGDNAVTDTDDTLRGCIATVNLTGSVCAETAQCLADLRAYNIKHLEGVDLEYFTQPAQLVEAGRDAVCSHALSEDYDFLVMIDGDAVFPANAFARILHTAYEIAPSADVVGAYAQLKSPPYLPTIDTGTGTWEPIFPGEGILNVIRTGGHFILVKTEILRRFGPPWFRTRRAMRPIDALREVDNYARIKLDGKNPLTAHATWHNLMSTAASDSFGGTSSVGEDSGFSDQVTAAGGTIVVDTNLVTGHLTRRTITPSDLKASMDARDANVRLACGVR